MKTVNMKRRADYQEMCRKMQELELSMTQGNLEYDALVERYRELGKPDRKIDKTTKPPKNNKTILITRMLLL